MKIVLASTSPRRVQLLTQAGCRFVIRAPISNEIAKTGEKPASLVKRLAYEKAASVAQIGEIVIGADTIVVSPDGKKVLGKPRNVYDARRMLKLLAGKTHIVFTGYCVLELKDGRERKVIRAVRSKVKMRRLSDADIRQYVASGEPMDKAGSYAAQGIGMALIEQIRGSYANVVGLPICQLLLDMEREFDFRLFQKKSGKKPK